MIQRKQVGSVLQWLLPSLPEVVFYLIIAVATLLLSSTKAMAQLFLLPPDSNLYRVVLDSINDLLGHLIGQGIQAGAVTAIFWALVGAFIYLLIWLVRNFSTEVTNDLIISNYAHPKGRDPYRSFKHLAYRSIFRLASFIVLVFYINTIILAFLPVWRNSFSELVLHLTHLHYIYAAVLAVVEEVAVFHGMTVILRLVMLRKRVFDG